MALVRVVVFGDSITWGSYDPEGSGWCNRLQAQYMQRSEPADEYVHILNCGISGDRLADVLNRFDDDMKSRASRWGEPLVIAIAIGINDSSNEDGPATSVEEFEHGYQELITKAKAAADGWVLAIEPTNVINSEDLFHNNATIATYVQSIREICGRENIPLVSLFGALEPQHLTSDLLHPNSAGHQFIAAAVDIQLQALISRMPH